VERRLISVTMPVWIGTSVSIQTGTQGPDSGEAG
jgi:hypothetical protein